MIATTSRRTTLIVTMIILSLVFSYNTTSQNPEQVDVSDFIPLWSDGMGRVSTGKYSPNGSELAIGSYCGGVFIYSSSNYEFQRKFMLIDERVNLLDWSYDGTRIAVCSERDIIILNSTSGGKSLQTKISSNILDMKWSPVDNRLAVKIYNEAIILDTISGDILLTIPDIKYLSWNPNGEEIACTNDDEIKIISSITGNMISRIEIDPPEGNIGSHRYGDIKWCSDGSKIAFAYIWYDRESHSYKSQLIVVDASTESVLGKTDVLNGTRSVFTWSPDSHHLALLHWGGKLSLFDSSLNMIRATKSTFFELLEMCWSKLRSEILIITSSSRISIMDVDSLDFSSLIRNNNDRVELITWSEDSKRIALYEEVWDNETSRYVKRIRILDAKKGITLKTFNTDSHIHSLDWNPNGDSIAISIDNQTRIIDYENGDLLAAFNCSSEAHVMDSRWSPSGDRIAQRNNKNTTWIWNVVNGEHILTFDHTSFITSITWSPDGSKIATSSYRTIKTWNAHTGEQTGTISVYETESEDNHIFAIEWSPDGNHMAFSYYPHTFGILNLSSGRVMNTFDQEELSRSGGYTTARVLKWSPDGSKMAARSDTIIIWDIITEEFKFLESPSHYSNNINTFDWSPDGARIAVGHTDGITRVWGSPADVKISSSSISFSKNNPYRDEKIQITFDIQNSGGLDAENLSVRVYNNKTLLEEKVIDLIEKDGESKQIQINFTPRRRENQIRILLDEEDLIPEFNNTNNHATKNLIAMEPTDYVHMFMVILGIIGSLILSMLLVFIVNKKKKKD